VSRLEYNKYNFDKLNKSIDNSVDLLTIISLFVMIRILVKYVSDGLILSAKRKE